MIATPSKERKGVAIPPLPFNERDNFMSTVFNPVLVYGEMVRCSRESGLSDSVVWENLLWLTAGRIGDYFMLVDCCDSIACVQDIACWCGGLPAVVDVTATDRAEAELASSFAYWHMLPSEVQDFAVADWLNGTSVETPVFQNTDFARHFVIENACRQFGYADSEDATFGSRDDD
jgi:hypothetical protein